MRIGAQTLFDLFSLEEMPDELEPRYNVAPTQIVPIVFGHQHRLAEPMRWGLVPRWADSLAIGTQMINARSETVFEKPAFRGLVKAQRCLIPTDGFYEWKDSYPVDLFGEEDTSKKPFKQPHHITLNSGQPFAMAGLWEEWRGTKTFTILTGEPNSLLGTIHDRMPIIVPPDRYAEWLDPTAETVRSFFVPFPDDLMQMRPVNRDVGKPTLDYPGLLDDA